MASSAPTLQPFNLLANARLSAVDLSRSRRRTDRISSRKLDRTFTHLRSATAYRSSRWVLEDVHDRDSARRHPVAACLFLASDPAVCWHFPARRTRQSHHLYAPVESHPHCVCCDRNSSVGTYETDRQKPRKSLGNGAGASHRWNHHVDC